MMVEDILPHALIEGLLSVRLTDGERNKVIQARVYFREHGSMPLKVVSLLRRLYKKKIRSIEKVQAAREAARISVAKEKMGISDRAAKAASEQRIERLKDSVNDLGF